MYLCYGDDSISKNKIGYIIIGIREEDVKSFLSSYARIKSAYQIPETYALHAVDLFNASKRVRIKEVESLQKQQVYSLSRDIINLCANMNFPRPLLASCDKKKLKKIIQKQTSWQTANFDEKQVLHLLKNSCLIHLESNKVDYKFYADKLDSKDKSERKAYPMFGSRTRKNMKNLLVPKNISDVGRLPESKYEEAPHKEFYEVADLFLYLTLKSMPINANKDKMFFNEFFSLINPVKINFNFSSEA